MRDMYLLGATVDHELIFADFGNEFGHFAASFVVVRPFSENAPYIHAAAESWIECMDAQQKWELCEDWDCRPSELAEELVFRYGVEEIIDCSCGPTSMRVNGEEWYFETVACGQCDPRDYIFDQLYCSKAAFNLLISLWDRYHLKEEVDDLTLASLRALFMEQKVQDKWVEDYIREQL